jgi:hypothetical protein
MDQTIRGTADLFNHHMYTLATKKQLKGGKKGGFLSLWAHDKYFS